ncbi:MAG: HypC/HybG/HupF family hydrogenase formation chaperone [bacterium]
MCLGVPGVVLEKNDYNMGVVDIQNIKQRVNLSLVDVAIGDWVIIHAGFAINKIDKQDAEETLSLLKEFKLIE